jgi:lipopolysaccharide transport system ATP-binding protein
MSDAVIRAENLGKKYVIGHQAENGRYVALRDVLMQSARTLWSRTKDLAYGRPMIAGDSLEEVWALKDVSFEIRQGEAVGIIGRNGAGKSTLLKILSRITEPSAGRVTIKGRVASLLEVGTGFHPELTGRENIYLNGAILGMTRSEIRSKFDEIVSFAETEKFLDTPVKRYSSGMYVRLAFAVAAHLEPEILLVDEVLAVGDTAFQEKCLGKMDSVARGGRTVFFVSHSMSAINTLCDRVIWLDRGGIALEGSNSDVVKRYLDRGQILNCDISWTGQDRPGDSFLRVESVRLRDANQHAATSFAISEDINLEIIYEVLQRGVTPLFAMTLMSSDGMTVFSTLSNGLENAFHARPLDTGIYRCVCTIPGNLLSDAHYHVSIVFNSDTNHPDYRLDHILSFDAIDDGVIRGDYHGKYEGIVRPKLPWRTEHIEPGL